MEGQKFSATLSSDEFELYYKKSVTSKNACDIIPAIKGVELHMEVQEEGKVVFTSPSEEERVVIKKAIISALTDPTSVKCPKVNFTEAFLKEPPMQLSMPQEFVEKLRKAYNESLEAQS